MKASRRFATAVVAVALLAGPAAAQSGESDAKAWLWRQCNEDVLILDLDPAPLQQFVDSEFTVVITDGKARVIIVVQDCASPPGLRLDGLVYVEHVVGVVLPPGANPVANGFGWLG